jgi:hypothetical protein
MKLLEIFGCEMPSTLVPPSESRVVIQKAIKREARTQLPQFMNTGSFRNRWLLCCSGILHRKYKHLSIYFGGLDHVYSPDGCTRSDNCMQHFSGELIIALRPLEKH